MASPAARERWEQVAEAPSIWRCESFLSPAECDLLALTPICPFRPRRMEGALLDAHDVVRITNLDAETKRPVQISYDTMTYFKTATQSIEAR